MADTTMDADGREWRVRTKSGDIDIQEWDRRTDGIRMHVTVTATSERRDCHWFAAGKGRDASGDLGGRLPGEPELLSIVARLVKVAFDGCPTLNQQPPTT